MKAAVKSYTLPLVGYLQNNGIPNWIFFYNFSEEMQLTIGWYFPEIKISKKTVKTLITEAGIKLNKG